MDRDRCLHSGVDKWAGEADQLYTAVVVTFYAVAFTGGLDQVGQCLRYRPKASKSSIGS